MTTAIKLLLLFLWLDILIYWLFTLNIVFIVLWLINTIFLLIFLGYNFDFFKEIINYVKNIDISKIWLKNKFKNDFSFKKDLWDFFVVLRDINKHYILIISLLVFLFILFSKIIWFNQIDLNIYTSLIILIFSIIIWYKDIISGEVYIWKKRLMFTDYIVFLSIILFYIFFNINWELELYQRLFVATLFATIFFIFSTKFLQVREVKYTKYSITQYFIILFVLSLFYFVYWFFNLKDMYQDFYEWKTKIITQIDWEKVFITPDNKEYRIVRDNDLFVLKSFRWQDYSFDSLAQTQEYILSFYKQSYYVEKNLSQINSKNTLTWSMTDKELIPYLLEDKDYDYLYNSELILPNIGADIENYKYYNIAYNLWIISLDSDLSDPVYCMNYIAMKWLAEKWDISQVQELFFFDKYYSKWLELWLVPKQCIEDKTQLFYWEFLNDIESDEDLEEENIVN